jgi:general secretion pathway protein G
MVQSAKRFIPANQRGMTLVEIMVVVIIIGLTATIAGVSVYNRLEIASRDTAKIQIRQISEALNLYRLSMRSYPSTAEGLAALVSPKGGEKPFMDEIPRDPWNENYVYIYPGTHNPQGFDLMSYGPDKVQGGDDDIGNWDVAGNSK